MHKSFFLALLILACFPLAGTAADSAKPAAEQPPARDPKYAAALEVLKLEQGVWDAAIEFPDAEAGQPPTKAKGVQTNTFITGDNWIKNEFEVDATYGGHGTWGYDPKQGKYVGIWVDSNQDYMRIDEGSFDAKTQTMTWTGELRQPAPHPSAIFRMIEEFKGDVRVLTMKAIGKKSGKEALLGTITFTRRKT